ncbi:MAG: cytochrome c peroxidase [Thermodesulfobacteriota bacterium]
MNWDIILLQARIYLGRLPAVMPGSEADTPERVALGKKLYFDRCISINKNKSCHDCHLLTKGRAGADVTPTSQGATGISGKRNAPTVINAGFQFAQFWDGRAPGLVEQAKGPILNPIEMALRTPEEVMGCLRQEKGYLEDFRRAFPGDPDPITFDNLAIAIAAFERTLVAPGRFDRLLDGQKNALDSREKRGLTKFIQYHCVECHGGVSAGGQLYKIIGQRHPYKGTDDLGRYEITKKEEDRFVFKVPMLRNVTRTAPYFNAGQVFTLEEAVTLMAWHQLDRRLTPGDAGDLIAFLRTLEGNPPRIEEPR